MNLAHFRTFIWLRWRLLINQIRRGGTVNRVLATIGLLLVILGAIAGFAISFPIGYFIVSRASPLALMLTWDGLIFTFIMFWMIGLLSDLQRSESLSLNKFLHLPVSLTGVFVLNYLSSLFSLSLLMMGPALVGLIVGLAVKRGFEMLALLPVLAAFVLMVTAVTYQFQGWLASLMVDKRRRRTVVVVVTLLFILFFQLPNLINVIRPWEGLGKDSTQHLEQQKELDRALAAKEITWEDYQRRREKLNVEYLAKTKEELRQTWQTVEETAWIINVALPPCWLALGAYGVAEGNPLPAILGTLGMTLVGAASLWRAYHTTMRIYRGEFTGGQQATPAPVAAKPAIAPSVGLVGRALPWVSEETAAIALAGLRSLTRAPEARILLLSPILMLLIFGGMLWRGAADIPEFTRPLFSFGAIAMMLVTVTQLVGNQFGYDRGGFRIFVLSPVSRRDILLGKNLAVAPIALGLSMLMVAFLQFLYPLRIDRLLAIVPQFVSMFLVFCLLANAISILAPMPVAQGSMKATNTRLLPVLLGFAFLFVFPMAMAPMLIPAIADVAMDNLELGHWPLGLFLAIVECGAVVWLYRTVIVYQGLWLQAREQRILEVVTTKSE